MNTEISFGEIKTDSTTAKTVRQLNSQTDTTLGLLMIYVTELNLMEQGVVKTNVKLFTTE